MGLKPSMLKVQIFALGAFYDSDLSSHRWIRRLIRAAVQNKTVPYPEGITMGFKYSIERSDEAPIHTFVRHFYQTPVIQDGISNRHYIGQTLRGNPGPIQTELYLD